MRVDSWEGNAFLEASYSAGQRSQWPPVACESPAVARCLGGGQCRLLALATRGGHKRGGPSKTCSSERGLRRRARPSGRPGLIVCDGCWIR